MTENSATPRPGLSLYANLLNPGRNVPGTISSAPVTYKQAESSPDEADAAKKQQALAASLRFQPTKRPQLAAQKAKAKAIANKLAALQKPVEKAAESTPHHQDASTPPAPPVDAQKETTSAADWINTAEDDEDVNNYYSGQKAQRGGRKKRKKNKDASRPAQQDWDDIYDPTRPNNYEEYKNSEEKIREVREWKDLLYRHRMNRDKSSDYRSDDEHDKEWSKHRQFAPPTLSFAPPAGLNDDPPPPPPEEDDNSVPPPAAPIPDDATGEDAFARRMRISNSQMLPTLRDNVAVPPSSLQPPPPAGQISRAPVRYTLPAADPGLPRDEAELAAMQIDEPTEAEDTPKSLRPGQSKFAERLMAKYGWSKGQGLGKEGTGVTSALYAKVDKRKKKPDAEGGGYVQPTTTGRILGGGKTAAGKEAEEGKFGAMSEVVRLQGMLRGMDLLAELHREQGGIMQEIGEECAAKYGNVERVYIHADTEHDDGAIVFVHFTNQLSALRAVNALDERIFNGNRIKAKFWDREKFDQGQYE